MRDGAAGSERAVLTAVALGGLLVPLNSTMIAVALPRLIDDLHVSLASAAWLVTAYLIAMAALQPLAGRLGDRLGRRRLILGGLAWFALASAGAALADSLPALIVFRVQQAAAGALIVPNGIALLRQAVPAERLGARMGLMGSVIAIGAAVGPPLGGVLVALGGWRSIFLVNLPLALIAIVLGLRAMPRDTPRPSGAEAHAAPLRALALFRRRAFAGATGAIALSNFGVYVTLLSLPVLLTRREGWDSSTVGVVLAAMSVAMCVASPLGGRLSDRLGRRVPAVWGLSLASLGLLPLAFAPATLPLPLFILCLVAIGGGTGMSAAALQVIAIESVGLGSAGIASGLFSTARYAGGIAGTSLLAGPLAPDAHGLGGFGLLLSVMAVAVAASVLLALAVPGGRTAPRLRAATPSASAAVRAASG
jgi:MFS family permease